MPDSDPELRFYSTAEVAKMFGVRTDTVWNWVRSGKLGCFRLGEKGAKMRFTRQQILDFTEQQRSAR